MEKLDVSEAKYQSLSYNLKKITGGNEMATLQKRIVGKSKEVKGEKDQLGYLQVFGGGGNKKLLTLTRNMSVEDHEEVDDKSDGTVDGSDNLKGVFLLVALSFVSIIWLRGSI